MMVLGQPDASSEVFFLIQAIARTTIETFAKPRAGSSRAPPVLSNPNILPTSAGIGKVDQANNNPKQAHSATVRPFCHGLSCIRRRQNKVAGANSRKPVPSQTLPRDGGICRSCLNQSRK